MQQAFSAPTEAEPDDLYRVVADLGTYPDWLALVDSVEPTRPDGSDRPTGSTGSEYAAGSESAAWTVTLRARIGPLARSKRLRMVRTVEDGRRVRFERSEIDGRHHSAWTLEAEVRPLDGDRYRSEVKLDLRYGGSMWSGLLDGVLHHAADEATERLQAYLSATR